MMQKPEGDRAKAPRVKAVVAYRDPLATPDLVASGFSEGEKRWRKIRPILECTGGRFEK
jgi:hypothetical protein